MTFEKILPGVARIHFKTMEEAADTVCRFQEVYDKPEVFSWKHPFVKDKIYRYYKKNFKIDYRTYFEGGFNFPLNIHCLDQYKPKLSRNEKVIVEAARLRLYKYFIVAFDSRIIRHELSHALFHVDKKYRDLCTKYYRDHAGLLGDIAISLKKVMGYSDKVVMDEVVSYLVDGGKDLQSELGMELDPYRPAMFYFTTRYAERLHRYGALNYI